MPTTPPPTTTNARTILAGSATPRLVARQFKFTGGPAVDKAGNVFFTDQPNDKIWKYGTDGQLTGRQVFVAQGSDGMTIDNEGNVYLTGQGVTVYNPAGQPMQHLDVPAGWTGNVCFGGQDRKTLFIAASEAVFGLPMRVHGV